MNPLLPLTACLCCLATAGAAEPLFLDRTRTPVERTTDFVSRLALEQKADLLDHKGPPVEVAGFTLHSDQWNQCLNGVQWNRPTTLFPTCIALGATWDPAFMQAVATVLSDEARAVYNHWHRDPATKAERKGLIYRAPVINISRNPYWGRIHEVFSEDPFLTSRMAVAYVKGLQGDDPRQLKIAATLKHFAVNNVEQDRHKLDAQVSERMLREYWLPHFRDAVVEGGASSLMASYNAINGTPNNINRWLLTDLLKGEWQHTGFVVSDLGGVKTMVEGHAGNRLGYVDAVAQSLMAGCDFSDKEFRLYIPEAVRSGKLTMQRLDDAVRRVVLVRMKLGEFDPHAAGPWSSLAPEIINGPAHRAVALQAVHRSIVLLENRGLLPLAAGRVGSIAVIGPHADRITKNSYNGWSAKEVTILAGLRARSGPGVRVEHALGAIVTDQRHPWYKESPPPLGPIDDEAALAEAVALAKSCEVAVVCVGTNAAVEHEDVDRTRLGLPGAQQRLVEAVVAANPRTVVVLMSAGPLAVPWIQQHAAAVLQAWWPGCEGGHGVADVLYGTVNPAGRLPYTVYASDQQVPSRDQYDVAKGFTYLYLKEAPLWAFGHGRSYTTFAYQGGTLSAPTAKDGEVLTATVRLGNTGPRDGDEVVQVYVTEPPGRDAQTVKPLRRLIGFQRVRVAAGASTEVVIPIEIARLRCWDERAHAFRAEPGTYAVAIGGSSDALPVSASFVIAP